MPRKDFFHETVKRALEKDGWRITHDPFVIEFEGLRLMADLGAERIFAAEREGNKIVVEVKVFGGKSKTSDFEKAIGQYDLYEIYLTELEPDRQVFLAVSAEVFEKFFQKAAIDFAVKKKRLRLLVFDHKTAEVVQWIS
jgi:hypothetical protein